jgi:hypothetical protein
MQDGNHNVLLKLTSSCSSHYSILQMFIAGLGLKPFYGWFSIFVAFNIYMENVKDHITIPAISTGDSLDYYATAKAVKFAR